MEPYVFTNNVLFSMGSHLSSTFIDEYLNISSQKM